RRLGRAQPFAQRDPLRRDSPRADAALSHELVPRRGSAHFEIREAGGNTDMLIRDRTLGAALARALGESTVVLMRGHGSTVVGGSIEEAVFRAIYTELNARLQLQALSLGEPAFLNDEEAAKATSTNRNVITRAWDLWVRDVQPID
ncbi:MAG: class II aldolase/adducin family protein, partial [Betaproteobacteria bacterium]